LHQDEDGEPLASFVCALAGKWTREGLLCAAVALSLVLGPCCSLGLVYRNFSADGDATHGEWRLKAFPTLLGWVDPRRFACLVLCGQGGDAANADLPLPPSDVAPPNAEKKGGVKEMEGEVKEGEEEEEGNPVCMDSWVGELLWAPRNCDRGLSPLLATVARALLTLCIDEDTVGSDRGADGPVPTEDFDSAFEGGGHAVGARVGSDLDEGGGGNGSDDEEEGGGGLRRLEFNMQQGGFGPGVGDGLSWEGDERKGRGFGASAAWVSEKVAGWIPKLPSSPAGAGSERRGYAQAETGGGGSSAGRGARSTAQDGGGGGGGGKRGGGRKSLRSDHSEVELSFMSNRQRHDSGSGSIEFV